MPKATQTEEQTQKLKLSYKELFEKVELLNALIPAGEENEKNQSKLKYAIQKMSRKIKPVVDEYNEKINDINVDCASVDKNDNILKETVAVGSGTIEKFKYTKENEKKRSEKVSDLMKTKVEFEPYYFSDETKIATLDEFLVEELRGFFFPQVA